MTELSFQCHNVVLLAAFLGLDPHTIARGRRQLLDRDVEAGRTRQSGAGRKAVEKKRPK